MTLSPVTLRRSIVLLVILCAMAAQPDGEMTTRGQAPSGGRLMYTGPGSCSSVSCHGSVKPVAGSRILQTEYSTWIVQDKHARATDVLTNAVSVRMAKLLGIGRPDTAPKCLACHALDVPAEQRARTFASQEGVSCESCHGPASGWLGEHTTRGWTHAQSVERGMIDTKDPVRRTEVCLACHLGNSEKFVDHVMIAAGHPDLVFDLEAFSAAMPRHWQENPAAEPLRTVRTWSAGQAVHLRASLERLAWRARGPVWPEYAELDCFSCHHRLTRAEDSWRQAQGYPARRPGHPPWNTSRIAVSRHVFRLIDAPTAQQVEAEVGKVAAVATRIDANRDEVAAAAKRAADLVGRLVPRAAERSFTRAETERLIRAIVEDAPQIAAQGERAAEQAAMALESLFAAHTPRGSQSGAARAAIDALFRQLEDPSAFDPHSFTAAMKKVGGTIP